MGKLTFDGIQSLIKNSLNKTPLNVLVQAIVVKDKNAEKISQQLSISWGNLHCVGVVPLQVKENLEAQRKPSMVFQYDLILITSCKVSSSNDKTVLVIKDMNIVKTGLKSKIGDPVLYDDWKKSGSFPKIKVENTIVPDSEEESKSPPISSGAIMRKSGIIETEIDEDDYTPISSLNSMNPDWIILAKVTAKSEIRTYPGKDGKGGKLFNFDLIDTRDGQINWTWFNSGVDKFFDVIQKGKVYRISRGSVRPANRRFTSIKNDYCIIIDDKTNIELVADTGKSKFKDAAFSFTKLKEISNIGAGRTIDLISIVYKDQGLRTVPTKNGDQSIRDLIVIDDNKDEDENTTLAATIGIWGTAGENLSVKPGEILALKNVKTNEYKGNVQLNHFWEDTIFTKEYLKHVKEAFLLLNWYKNLNIGEIKNISEANTKDPLSKTEQVLFIFID